MKLYNYIHWFFNKGAMATSGTFQIVLQQMDAHMQKYDIGPLPHTVCEN